MTLDIQVEKQKGGKVDVVLSGRLDSTTAQECEARVTPLLTDATKTLSLELGKLDYISSAGVRLLILAEKFLAKHGGTVELKNPQPQVKEVLALVNIFPKMDVFKTEQSADIYLDAIQRKSKSGHPDVSE